MDKQENIKDTKEKKKIVDNKKDELKEKIESTVHSNIEKDNKDIKMDNNKIDESKEEKGTEIIKNEDITTDEKKLKKIKEAIKESKEKSKNNEIKNEKYIRIFRNVVIAVMGIAYITINIIGAKRIPQEQYQLDLKVFIVLSVIAAILLFEKAFKDDKFRFALLGIEMLVLGGATIMLLHLYNLQNTNILKYSQYFILTWCAYYIIKSIIIAVKRVDINKKEVQNNWHIC